jgi:hypothetical protein
MGNKIMNEDRDQVVESMAKAWTIETVDLSHRISTAIGADSKPNDPMEDFLQEIRALRQEMDAVRQSNFHLQIELARLRHELTTRKAIRIAPYAPIDNLVRLS